MKHLITLLIFSSVSFAFDVTDTINLSKAYSPDLKAIAYDSHFDSLTSKQFTEAKKEFNSLMSRHRKNSEVFDCDDFARTFQVVAKLLNLKYGKNFAVGLLGVNQTKPALGVSGSGQHMLILIVVDDTPLVYEPQTNKSCTLFSYPNKKNIQQIIF